jgi:putative salt-induced outer membrane protein YdiY
MKTSFRQHYILPLILCLLIPVLTCQARSSEVDTPKEQADATQPWNLTLNGGLTIHSGNTRSRLLHGEINFDIRLDGFILDSDFETLYGRSDSEVIQKKGKWANSFTRSLTKRLNLFGQVLLEYDAIAGITLRTTTGLGLRVDIHDREKIKTTLTTSLNGEFLNYEEPAPNQQYLRLHISLAMEARFSETSQLKTRILYTPDVADLWRNYRLEADASLSMLMKEPVWITLKLMDRYNNLPLSAEIRKNDLTLITAVEIRF